MRAAFDPANGRKLRQNDILEDSFAVLSLSIKSAKLTVFKKYDSRSIFPYAVVCLDDIRLQIEPKCRYHLLIYTIVFLQTPDHPFPIRIPSQSIPS